MIAYTPPASVAVANNTPQGALPDPNQRPGFTPYVPGQAPAAVAPPIPAPIVRADPFNPTTDPTKQTFGGSVRNLLDLGKGAVKDVVGNLQRLGNLVAKPIAAGIDALSLKPGEAPQPVGLDDATLKENNPAQQAGGAISEAAQILGPVAAKIPGVVEEGVNAASKALSAAKAERETAGIADTLTPKLTPIAYKAAGKAGNLAEPSLFKAAGVSTDAPQVQKAVEAVKNVATDMGQSPSDIIRPTASVTANVNNVHNAISSYSEDVIKPFLSENPVQTNFKDFIDYIKQVQPPTAIKSNVDAYAAFNRVQQRVISEVYNSVKSQSALTNSFEGPLDPNVYWNARKQIDAVINDELGAKTFTDTGVTGVKAAAKALRQGTADFVSDMLRFPGQMEQVASLREGVNALHSRGFELDPSQYDALARQVGLDPTGASVANKWDYFMKNLQGLYTAGDNLSTKVTSEQGKNLIQIMMKRYPLTTKALKIGATAVGAGALFKVGESTL